MEHNNQKLREQHSLMEGQRSSSYAIFADAPEYWFSYDAYLELFKQYAQRKETVSILNIGAATGILEFLALRDIPNLHFVSVDNSKDFTDRFQKKNKEAIKAGKVEHVLSSVQDFETDRRFDIIVARDFNHHIEMDVVEQYIKHCYGMLNEGGSFIIEDLKREAEEVGINDLVKVVYSIPAFQTDDYNRYHKIMGIIDSYFVAYHTDEIKTLLDRLGFPYELQNEKYRYKFIVRNAECN